jgi:hypothetical protein
MVEKYQGWETRLTDYIDSVRNKPFNWSNHNCAIFVANCVKVTTGVDLIEEFRGVFATEAQAYSFMNEKGFQTLRDATIAKLGEPIQNINFAKRGDIVLLTHETDIHMLGIVEMSGRAALTTGEKGLRMIPRKQWVEFWSIK